MAKFLQEIDFRGRLEDIDIIYENFARHDDKTPNRWRCVAGLYEKAE